VELLSTNGMAAQCSHGGAEGREREGD